METVESEREEGEIVDDELEDVSDCPITTPFCFGKSVSAIERLRSVSLSSISDSDLEDSRSRKNGHCIRILKSSTPYAHPKPRRKSLRKRKRSNGEKKVKRLTLSSSDSEGEKFDRKTLRQLKEAVHIDTSKEVHQNSLRTRLKALIDPVSERSHTEDEAVTSDQKTEQSADNNNEIKKPNDVDVTDDKELAELRLEALKSAVLKKHLERKKRKACEKGQKDSGNLDGGDINKENTNCNVNIEVSNENNPTKRLCLEETKKNDVNITIEEDVDIMRAMLLASMSRKITEESELTKNSINKPTKPVTQPGTAKSIIPVPKPIKRTIKNNYFSVNNKIVRNARTVSKSNTFKPTLPNVEPLIININNDSDSDMDIEEPEESDVTKSVTDFLNQQRAEVEAKKMEEEAPLLDKSAMRLLPFSQQIEYHRLKQQLNAKKAVRLRKAPLKDSDQKLKSVRNRNVVRSKFSYVKQNTLVKDKIKLVRTNKTDRGNANSLQRTLNDMQMQKDGRLQVKGKYQELAPILKKVNQVSVERKRYENEIKRLLQELEKTKQKFSASHQNFKNLVEELIRKKETIDQRTTNCVPEKKEVQKSPVLLAPFKSKNVVQSKPPDINKLQGGLPSATPVEKAKELLLNGTLKNSNTVQSPELNAQKDLEHIVDPNDLNEQIMNQNKVDLGKAPSLPQYVSPLDKRDNEFLTSDPLTMLCPFDLLGVCKDKECTYRHCS